MLPEPANPAISRPLGRTIQTVGLAVAVVGTAVLLVGWGLDVRAVRSILPDAVSMKPLTAVGLVLAALALVVLARPDAGPAPRRLARAAAGIVAAIGAAVLAGYVLGLDSGVDELLFEARHAAESPGRFAPTTAICFVLIGTALLAFDRPRRGRWSLTEVSAAPVAVVAAMSLMGYAYSIPSFYGPASGAKMAVPTAACLIALALAVILARPHGRLLAVLTATSPGDVRLRRVAPLVTIVPLALGWVGLRLQQNGVLEPEVGAWWVAAATTALLACIVWRDAASLSRADADRARLERRLREQAGTDHLTGVSNRGRFAEELDHVLARRARHGGEGALVVLDLDRMKAVNDELGHLAGDRMLVAVAAALHGRLRASDFLARIGGDEFAVILEDVGPGDAVRAAEGFVRSVREAGESGEGSAWTTASAGVATFGAPGAPWDPEQLLAGADDAMYAAKRGGGDSAVLAPALRQADA